jgi:paraquat-inducible protein B
MGFAKLGDYDVFPTVQTGLARLEEQIAAVLSKLEKLPLTESLAKLDAAVEQSAKTLEAAETAFSGSESVLVEARDALIAVRGVLEDPEFAKLPGEVREMLTALRGSLEGVGPDSSVYGDLRRTMDELRGAARSIERVADTIDQKPNALIFGKGLKREVIPRAIPTR